MGPRIEQRRTVRAVPPCSVPVEGIDGARRRESRHQGTMTDFIQTVRGSEPLSEGEALDALEVLVPVLLAAPEDHEAIEAASGTIARMPPDSALAAVMDWWFVVTTGCAPALGLAFRLPESMPHALRQAMDAVTKLTHQALTVPPARWVQARRELDRLLGDLDHNLRLDSYGKSKLSGEREAWSYLL